MKAHIVHATAPIVALTVYTEAVTSNIEDVATKIVALTTHVHPFETVRQD